MPLQCSVVVKIPRNSESSLQELLLKGWPVGDPRRLAVFKLTDSV